MVAASCQQGPTPAATFGDLPRAYRDDLLRFALVAAASSAFFITLAIVMRPLPSRSMAGEVSLPEPLPPRSNRMDARLQSNPPGPQVVRALRPRAARPRYELATFEEPAVDVRRAAPARPGRRGNAFTRLLRNILGRPAPATTLKTDPTD
jgi:hypothetical protein